jgi:hypothetical protein
MEEDKVTGWPAAAFVGVKAAVLEASTQDGKGKEYTKDAKGQEAGFVRG